MVSHHPAHILVICHIWKCPSCVLFFLQGRDPAPPPLMCAGFPLCHCVTLVVLPGSSHWLALCVGGFLIYKRQNPWMVWLSLGELISWSLCRISDRLAGFPTFTCPLVTGFLHTYQPTHGLRAPKFTGLSPAIHPMFNTMTPLPNPFSCNFIRASNQIPNKDIIDYEFSSLT